MPQLAAVSGDERRDEAALRELERALPSHRIREAVVNEVDGADSLRKRIVGLTRLHLEYLQLQLRRGRFE